MKIKIRHKKSGISKEKYPLFDGFIRFLQSKLPLNEDLDINFVSQREGKMTTGSRRNNGGIFVLTKKRITRDILRTLAHEWVHEYQITILKRPHGPDIGGENEDEANAYAGQLVKLFEKKYPEINELMYE